jgi:hypothetical protein
LLIIDKHRNLSRLTKITRSLAGLRFYREARWQCWLEWLEWFENSVFLVSIKEATIIVAEDRLIL